MSNVGKIQGLTPGIWPFSRKTEGSPGCPNAGKRALVRPHGTPASKLGAENARRREVTVRRHPVFVATCVRRAGITGSLGENEVDQIDHGQVSCTGVGQPQLSVRFFLQASILSRPVGEKESVKVVFMSYRNTLQAERAQVGGQEAAKLSGGGGGAARGKPGRLRGRRSTKLKPRWDVHLSGDDDQLGLRR